MCHNILYTSESKMKLKVADLLRKHTSEFLKRIQAVKGNYGNRESREREIRLFFHASSSSQFIIYKTLKLKARIQKSESLLLKKKGQTVRISI